MVQIEKIENCVVFTTQYEETVIDGKGESMADVKVSPLKKVSLDVSAASSLDVAQSADKHLFSFIYGAASGGLCPFEIELANRHSGELFDLTLSQDEIHDFFGHLFISLKHSLSLHILPPQLCLNVAINAVEKAEDIEVISAMKEYIGSGCGGGGRWRVGPAGCGCGSHLATEHHRHAV